jgi:hypothetical protein
MLLDIFFNRYGGKLATRRQSGGLIPVTYYLSDSCKMVGAW